MYTDIIEIDNDERGVIGDFTTISDIRIAKAKPCHVRIRFSQLSCPTTPAWCNAMHCILISLSIPSWMFQGIQNLTAAFCTPQQLDVLGVLFYLVCII